METGLDYKILNSLTHIQLADILSNVEYRTFWSHSIALLHINSRYKYPSFS